jgi:death on curing protein
MNHGYVDENKRVGAHAAMLFLAFDGLQTSITPKQLEEITLAVARGGLEADALAIWFRQWIFRSD